MIRRALALTMLALPAVAADVLVHGGPMHGVNGMAVGPDSALYAASFLGQSIYKIDRTTGAVTVAAGPFHSGADDVAVRNDGLMAWTMPGSGELWIKPPGQAPRLRAKNLAAINPLTWYPDGKLLVGQIGGADTLWRIDPENDATPEPVLPNAGQINGFAFGPDGRLYAPQWQRDGIVAIDFAKRESVVVIDGLGMPAAVKVAADGALISVDWLRGEIRRTDPKNGQSRVLATLPPPLDNLALAADGTIYVANPADSIVTAIDPATGDVRTLVHGNFSVPAGMASVMVNGRATLLVADPLGYRAVDAQSGKVQRPAWTQDVGMALDIAANERFIVVSHPTRGVIQKLARGADGISGALVEEFRHLKTPTGVAVLDNGEIIATDYGTGQLVRVGTDSVSVIAEHLGGPIALRLASQDEVLVSESRVGIVSRINLRSGQRTVIARDLDLPQGLALLKDGRVAVVEKGKNRVVAVNAGAPPEVLAADLPLRASIFRAMPDVGIPSGLAADSSGDLYVACGGDNSIRKIPIH